MFLPDNFCFCQILSEKQLFMQLFFLARSWLSGAKTIIISICVFRILLVFLRTTHPKVTAGGSRTFWPSVDSKSKICNHRQRMQHSRKTDMSKKHKESISTNAKMPKTHRKESHMKKQEKIVKIKENTKFMQHIPKTTTNKHLQTPIKKTVTITWIC